MNLLETIEFRVNVVGDKTNETYFGDFTALRRLSHRQELTRDRIYRELIGPSPDNASERAVSQAEMFADLKVCLIKSPTWWKEAGEGLDLADDNVVQSVWAETVRIRVDAFNETKKKGEEAAAKLKNIVETEPVGQ